MAKFGAPSAPGEIPRHAVLDEQAFVTDNGRQGPRAHTLKEFVALLSAAFPVERIRSHLAPISRAGSVFGIIRSRDTCASWSGARRRKMRDDARRRYRAINPGALRNSSEYNKWAGS